MPLPAGARLGPYEILAPLGAGGMGEVYRARDTRLDRTVAIKILPEALAADPQFRERFDREARAISQLDHPHICALYDVGEDGGVSFLVMQYLEGETLAERLKRGALPLDQALRHAIEIADALDAAHHAGIVHRDLKPGNVMLTKGGARLLDFGLAKTTQSVPASGGFSALPTTPPGLTAQGTILGTFQYMAPEQLEGRDADARADIWAFGCVVYEMVSGKRAFEGTSAASLIGAIMAASPRPLGELIPVVPLNVDRVVRTCLAKDPLARFQSARDVATYLRWQMDGPELSAATQVPSRQRPVVAVWIVVAVCAAAAAGYFVARGSRGAQTSIVRFAIPPPDAGGYESTPALAPQGEQAVAVVRDSSGTGRLWLMKFSAEDAKPLAGTEGAAFPFWSPDGASVAFFADGKLKRLDVRSGSPLTIADAPSGRGGVWTEDGQILFAPAVESGLMRINASGGDSSPLTSLAPDDVSHRFPFLLPDGRFGYYVSKKKAGEGGIWIGRLNSPTSAARLLHSAQSAQCAAGFLFFVRDETLVAQRFDSSHAQVVGDPISVADHVAFASVTFAPAFSVSRDGSIVVRRKIPPMTELGEYARDGRLVNSLTSGSGSFTEPELSPDGRQLSYLRIGSGPELWVYDLARRTAVRVLTDPPVSMVVWSPDGNRFVAQGTGTAGAGNLFELPITGGSLTPVAKGQSTMHPFAWTRSTFWWIQIVATPLGVLTRMGSDGVPHTYFDPRSTIDNAQISTDERWIAYTSNQSGRPEVYVIAASSPGQSRRVSTDGGSQPRWRRDGAELFYLGADGTLMAVTTRVDHDALAFGSPTRLFASRVRGGLGDDYQYDVAPDGGHFFVNVAHGAPTDVLSVVLNWAGAQIPR